MQLPLQDFTALVRLQAAAVANAARVLVDLSAGSVLRALVEANASVALWVQWLIVEVLSLTRAATSNGSDLDSWVADFGLARLPAVAARGMARFGRVTPGLATTVPVGALVRTGVGTDAQAFQVVADNGNAAWSGAGYALAAAAADVSVPVQAVVPGRAGNVQAGVLTMLSTAIPGVDSVTNDAAASGGLDAEPDDALRTRFGSFIDSRSRATEAAISFAIQSVQQGLQFLIAERVDTSGATRPGCFTVVLDDGSGSPSDALIGSVAAAIEAVRPVGGTFGVRRPALLAVNVTMHLVAPADAAVAAQTAVGSYVQSLAMGATLVLSRVVQVAHDADPRVQSVSGVTLNGVAGDLAPPMFGRLVLGSVVLS